MGWLTLIPWKYLGFAAVLSFAFYFIWDMGRDHERSKWQLAMAQEVSRQTAILDAATAAANEAALLLMEQTDERLKLIRRLQYEARNSPNADNACLDASSILRLNQIVDPSTKTTRP